MATTANEADEKDNQNGSAPKIEKTLEELILNRTHGKYQVVELISFHAKHLRQLEEFRHLTQTEVLELAMREVLSGTVSEEELLKKLIATPKATGKKDAEKPAKKK